MSRIGKNPVAIPAGVSVKVENKEIIVEGKLGKLVQPYADVSVEVDGDHVIVSRPSDAKDHRAKHGLYRSLIDNMVHGVSTGWSKQLELVGVGYRAQVKGQALTLNLGFSHPIEYALPKKVIATMDGNTKLSLVSCDKQLLGQVASEIRAYRPPEPYKGKGVKYAEEHIIRKAGKAGKGGKK
jgi:large subunit ribosomal protein L6